jgi:hypothetical protein
LVPTLASAFIVAAGAVAPAASVLVVGGSAAAGAGAAATGAAAGLAAGAAGAGAAGFADAALLTGAALGAGAGAAAAGGAAGAAAGGFGAVCAAACCERATAATQMGPVSVRNLRDNVIMFSSAFRGGHTIVSWCQLGDELDTNTTSVSDGQTGTRTMTPTTGES